MKLGIMGTGIIASALVEGVAADGHTIVVSERSASHAARLSGMFENVRVASNQEVVDASDIVIVGLMADAALAILAEVSFRTDQKVISLMANAPLSDVAKMVAPAKAAATLIPFPGIAKGGSPVIALGDQALVHALVGGNNSVFMVRDEAELVVYLSAQAVLSPVIKMIDDAAGWLGDRVEDDLQAERFLRVLVGSSALSNTCGSLLEALNTPGGYNQRLREHMSAEGMSDALIEGMNKLEVGA